jgi:hypothetical protein
MPQIVGKKVAVNDGQTIADSLRNIGESMYRPIDPVSQERIRQMQMQDTARANAIDALQRGDMREYVKQGIMANLPVADASGYARSAGLVGADGRFVGPDGAPLVPRFSPAPQPPAPMATGGNAAAPQSAPQSVGSSPWS